MSLFLKSTIKLLRAWLVVLAAFTLLSAPAVAEPPVRQEMFQPQPSSVSIRTADFSTTFIAGVPVTIVAEVSPFAVGGLMYFYDGATFVGTAQIIGSSATLTLTFGTGESPALRAYFPGDSLTAASTSGTLFLTELFDTTKENLTLATARDRMRHLFLDQPDLIPLLRRTAETGMTATLSGKNGAVSGSGSVGPLWFRLAGSQTEDDAGSSHYVLLSFGSHVQLGPDAIIGAMAQIDSIGYSNTTGSSSGNGWLAGPYAVARFGDLPLWVEGRLLWGKSRNRIQIDGQPDETISGDRFLGLVKLSGAFDRGRVSLRPYLSLGHGTESFDLYTTSQGVPILGTGVWRSEAALGLDLSADLTGALRFDGGLGLVGIREDGGTSDTTLRVRLGLDHTAASGLHSYIHLLGQGGGSLGDRTFGADLGVRLAF